MRLILLNLDIQYVNLTHLKIKSLIIKNIIIYFIKNKNLFVMRYYGCTLLSINMMEPNATITKMTIMYKV